MLFFKIFFVGLLLLVALVGTCTTCAEILIYFLGIEPKKIKNKVLKFLVYILLYSPINILLTVLVLFTTIIGSYISNAITPFKKRQFICPDCGKPLEYSEKELGFVCKTKGCENWSILKNHCY